MLGENVQKPGKGAFDLDYIGIKASQFSFSRLAKADPVLGVDMASTGEVGCIGEDFYEALLKSMLSVGYRLPKKNIMLSSGETRSKTQLLNSCRMLAERGFNLFATRGTAEFLKQNDIEVQVVYWPDEDAKPNVMELIRNKTFDLVINPQKSFKD
jgi:carbamoyl-phosphate synthase large subunit